MNAKLFYFSGTGNSIAAAREIAQQIDTKDINNIANCRGHEIEVDNEVVGFIFPVYFQDVPEVVKKFVNKLKFKNNPYIFAVATCNGGPGFTLFNLDKILKSKGELLSSGFTLTMPGNSVIILDLTSSPELQRKRLANSSVKMGNISDIIKDQLETGIEGENRVKTRLGGFLTSFVATKVYQAHRKFVASEKCTLCGTCQRICPESNIKMNEKVIWGNCDLCLACFHWCPQKGIEIGNSTKSRIRYHHPDINLKDMILR